jgi:hypothetical protein
MARRDDGALNALKHISAETTEALEKLTDVGEDLAGKSSSSLFGALGALVGGTAAYLLSVAYPGLSLIELGPLLAGTGFLAPMLAIRGRTHLQLERRTEEQKLLLRNQRLIWDDHQDRIKKLPRDVPPEVKSELWRRMIDIDQAMHAAVMPKTGLETSPTRALPSPSKVQLLPPPNEQGKSSNGSGAVPEPSHIEPEDQAGTHTDEDSR